jgi:hypothetical protein
VGNEVKPVAHPKTHVEENQVERLSRDGRQGFLRRSACDDLVPTGLETDAQRDADVGFIINDEGAQRLPSG